MSRWVELSYIEDVKTLTKHGLSEYYNKANQGLFEFINPSLSYDYEEVNMSNGQKMWKVEKQNNDPQFLITLKNDVLDENWKVFDFYFFETGFDKQSGLEGKYYLDTLSKVIKDEVIPYFLSSPELVLYFNPYNGDGGGETRKKVFERIINKFMNKNEIDIEIEGEEFIITKKEE
jgi:hypothetical protein